MSEREAFGISKAEGMWLIVTMRQLRNICCTVPERGVEGRLDTRPTKKSMQHLGADQEEADLCWTMDALVAKACTRAINPRLAPS